jgi:hypothetical protein
VKKGDALLDKSCKNTLGQALYGPFRGRKDHFKDSLFFEMGLVPSEIGCSPIEYASHSMGQAFNGINLLLTLGNEDTGEN